MILTLGENVMQYATIRSNDSTATIDDAALLVDGQPGTSALVTWPETVTGADYVTLVWSISPAPALGHPPRLFALLGLGSEFQVGTVLELYGGTSNNPTNLVGSTTVQRLPNGTLGAWLYLPSQVQTWAYWGWRIVNNAGDGSYLTAGQDVTIGEVFGDAVVSWPLATFGVGLTDPSAANRSSRNVARRVMRYPFRKLEATLVAQRFYEAFVDPAGSLQSLRYALAAAKYFAIVPRERERGGVAVDDDYVRSMAMLVCCTSLGELSSDAARDAYPLPLTTEELL